MGSHGYFRQFFEHANEAMFIIDPDQDKILDANLKACRMLGYSRGELLATPISTIHRDEIPKLLDFIHAECRQGSGWSDQFHCLTKAGTIIPAEISAAIIEFEGRRCVAAVVRDSSERQRAAIAWRTIVEATTAVTGTEFFRALVRQLALQLGVRYTFVAEFAPVRTRFRTLAFWTDNRFIESMEYDLANTACEQVLAGNLIHHPDNVQKQFPKSHDLAKLEAVSYFGIPLRDHQGTVMGHMAMIDDKPMPVAPLDLSFLKLFAERAGSELERGRTAEDLLKAKQAAETANRAKSEFLAHMSHELRTPLNGILGYAQILKRPQNLTSDQSRAVTVVQHCGEHLLNLINDLLDLSKIEAQKLELSISDFSLAEFLQLIAETIRVKAESKGLAFRYEAMDGLPQSVQGDERRLRQVLVNLLGNAVKFTETGAVYFRVRYRQPQLCFEVEDTGSGIPADQVEDIFLPFRQLKQPHKQLEGTGLGLAISQRLTQAMGGALQVESTPGQGSLFRLKVQLAALPRLESGNAKPTSYQEIAGYRGPVLRLLVVDDKTSNRHVLRDMLTPLGFQVSEAVNGKDALDKMATCHPHAVLMDLVMPVLDGFEATRRLRSTKEGKDIIVIAVSASVFEHDRDSSVAVGCDDFLAKPIRTEALLDCLKKHLRLQWLYAPPSSMGAPSNPDLFSKKPPFALPKETIKILRELAEIGDLYGIGTFIDQLEQTEQHLQPFTTQLRELVRTFQINNIRDYLTDSTQAEP
jgi:PAS domain S-box-containing protein